MGLKEIIKNTFNNENDIVIERYRGAKTCLIFISLFFFVNFYLVGAGFYSVYLIKSLGFLYILLLVSFILYFYFLFRKLLIKNNKLYFNIIFFIILLLIFGFLSLPVVLDGGFNGILKIIKLYY